MTSRESVILLFGLLVVLNFSFQLQLRLYALSLNHLWRAGDLSMLAKAMIVLHSLWQIRVFAIAILAPALFLTWLGIMSLLEASMGLPLASASLALSALGIGLYLGEHVTVARIAGIAVVALGVTLVLRN